MKLKMILMSCSLITLFTISQFAIAGASSSQKVMAKILSHLNHYPSDTEKSQLSDIIKNTSSDNEKAVAKAILNLRHSASDADKSRLKKIMNDGDADAHLKDLAGIVYRLTHKPSSSDKELLTAILD